MTHVTYNWKRFWIPREGRFVFDHQGFLLSPPTEKEWAEVWETDVVSVDEIIAKPCLVLLGEPGIGKSFAIDDMEKRLRAARSKRATVLSRNLNGYTTDTFLVDDIFRSPEFTSWRQHGGELHVFLDSFDECLVRVDTIAELLAAQFSRVPSVENLFLRIGSRTAEWRTSLEDALREKWGETAVEAYELAPLTRQQVLEAAEVDLRDADHFVEEVVAGEVVSFAIKPLTLRLLIDIWKARGGSLPPTQREIYEQGCLELCTDSERRRTPKLQRQFSPEQRLAVASHIAAAMLFCNRPSVWTGSSRAGKPEADISLAELVTGSVTVNGQQVAITEHAVRESFDTGLFTSRGRNRLGWSHQTYAEFLAARFLSRENFNTRQVFDLLTYPHDAERKLIPQLQETAAWAATPGSDLFYHLARVQPDILLGSDVATADAKDKFALIEAMMSAFATDSVHDDWWVLRKRYRKLRHTKVETQIRKYLRNRKLAATARVEAIEIAEACELSQLLPEVLRLALDTNEDSRVRESAVGVVVRSSDEGLKAQLRPLALGDGGADANHDLRGGALSACWPRYLSANELFSSLVPPDERYAGFYHSFLSRELVQKLAVKDLPTAIAWAEAQPKDPYASFNGRYAGLVLRILEFAAEHLDHGAILVPFARATLTRLEKHDFLRGGGQSTRLIQTLQSRSDLRLKLTEAMVPFWRDQRSASSWITRGPLRLIVAEDLPWLLTKFRSARSRKRRRAFANLIARIFYPDDAARIDSVIEAARRFPVLVEVMPHWLKPVFLGSDDAKNARSDYFDDQRYARLAQKRPGPKAISPSPSEQISVLLGRFDTGETDVWWKICCCLELEDSGQGCDKHYYMDIRTLIGWKKATGETRSRLLEAADSYVREHEPSPAKWFANRKISYRPAVAGFRALLLLAREAPAAFASIPSEVWQRWIPAILRLHHYDELNDHQLLAKAAFQRAPREAIEWTVKVVNQENKEGENLWILAKLALKCESALGGVLLQRIKQGRLKPECFCQLLTALIDARVPGALDLTRSRILRCVPSDKRAREMALLASRLLMIYGELGDWPRVRKLIDSDASFGRALIEGFAHDYNRAPAGILKTMSEREIGSFWEWVLAHYPTEDDPDRTRGGIVTTRYAMANLRDSLISYLANLGTEAGCRELQRLTACYPEFSWLRRVLMRAREQMRRQTWQPVTPAALFRLAANRHGRLIQSGEQLLETVLDSLDFLEQKLQGETPRAQFLWDGDQHKPEGDISDWIQVHLEDDLKQRGVVPKREVQIHRFERTDIHITAVTQADSSSYGCVKVIIEVKGSWNDDLMSAMRTQLVGRYLKDSDCRHGLYLVAWFPKNSQKHTHKRSKRSLLSDHKALEDRLGRQAHSLSGDGRTIRAKVIDFSRKVSAKKRNSTL